MKNALSRLEVLSIEIVKDERWEEEKEEKYKTKAKRKAKSFMLGKWNGKGVTTFATHISQMITIFKCKASGRQGFLMVKRAEMTVIGNKRFHVRATLFKTEVKGKRGPCDSWLFSLSFLFSLLSGSLSLSLSLDKCRPKGREATDPRTHLTFLALGLFSILSPCHKFRHSKLASQPIHTRYRIFSLSYSNTHATIPVTHKSRFRSPVKVSPSSSSS